MPMIIKKSGKNIIGAKLTAAETKAMEIEIQKKIAEFDRKNELEIDAVVLLALHDIFGFGPARLRRFFDEFSISLGDLVDRYEMNSSDEVWLATRKLKELGIDLEEWYKSKGE